MSEETVQKKIAEIPLAQQRAMEKLIGKPYVQKVPTSTDDVAAVLRAQDKRARKAARRLKNGH